MRLRLDPGTFAGTVSRVALAASVAAFATGCSVADSPEDRLIETVKSSYASEDWMDRITDWDAGGVADFSPDTDLPADDARSYGIAVEICEAIRSEVAVGADEPLIRVFGVKTSSSVEVDGSSQSVEESEMIAQFASTFGDECGATPPSNLKDAVQEDGIPLY